MNNYKNRIKKFLTYIVCIVSLISLYACNNINSLDDSEFIIIDNNNHSSNYLWHSIDKT